MKPRSGQAAVEFLALFIIVLAGLAVASAVSLQKTQAIYQAQTGIEAGKLLTSVSTKINSAFIEGDGFSINMTLPQDIFTYDYSIALDTNHVIITVANNSYFRDLLTENITGTLGKGANTITNVNGEIVIN
ncbi:MAG: hypothetical protein HY367_03300 [Candidatus Aenigmarchaeota archaeon]|nr:hypothetical protein [Candidatus Aenigmarchaeota archaeon]